MSYDQLRSHAEEIKQLAIDKTVEVVESALSGDPDRDYAVSVIRQQAEQTFAGVENIFDDWLDLPDPWLLGGGTGNIAAALPYLASSSYLRDETATQWAGGGGTSASISQIEPTGAFMQGWTSGTALSYASFASMFGPVTANLSMAAHVLKGACEAEEALWTEARKSIDELAHATIDALGSVNDKDPKAVSAALTVLGAVAGIVAVPFTAGGSLVAAYSFAAIAGGLSVGGIFVAEEQESSSTITGGTPQEIVESLRSEMTKLNNEIIAKEDDIAQALQRSADDFEAAYALEPGQSPVKMPRPTLADNPTLGGRE